MALRNGTGSSARIVEAAIDLFHRKGYEATSLREVADAVGLKVGSLYNHISSKEELLFGIMQGVMTELIDHTREAMAAEPDPVGRIRAFMRASIHFHATRRKETFIGNSELRSLGGERREQIVALRDEYQQLLADALVAAAETDGIEIDDVQLATFSGIALCASVATWYRPGGRLTLEDLEERLPALFAPLATSVADRRARAGVATV